MTTPNRVLVGGGPSTTRPRDSSQLTRRQPSSQRAVSAQATSQDHNDYDGFFRYNQEKPKKQAKSPSAVAASRAREGGAEKQDPHGRVGGAYDGDEKSLRELAWTPIVVGNEEPENLRNGSGWIVAPGYSYPFDIVLGLRQMANIYKVVVEVNDRLYPSSIEVCIGRGAAGEAVDYTGAKKAEYGVKGDIFFVPRGQARLEPKTFYTDHVGNYIWLIVHKPPRTKANINEQFGIEHISVFGYPMDELEGTRRRASPAPAPAPAPTPAPMPTPVHRKTPSPLPSPARATPRRDSSKMEAAPDSPPRRSASTATRHSRPDSAASTVQRPVSVRRDASGLPRSPTPQNVRQPSAQRQQPPMQGDGSGMRTESVGLASDPLTTIRTVKRALLEKKGRAEANGMDVEANTCFRAVQRLEEYEGRLEELAKRKADALIHKDYAEAEVLGAAMADCRDTVFRVSHIDLLLSRAELRSIGVTSDWSS